MNEIVNKFLLAGDKFMPELDLRQPGFTYSACGPFTKNEERIKKFEETQTLAEKLHKPIIRKFKKRKVQSPFIGYILGADLADMQLISTFNKEFRFLLCVIDIFSKYARVISLKDKKGITITNAFQNFFKRIY